MRCLFVLLVVLLVLGCGTAEEDSVKVIRRTVLEAVEADHETALFVAQFDYEFAREDALDVAGIDWLAIKANSDYIDRLRAKGDFPAMGKVLLEAAEARADYTVAEADYKAALDAAEKAYTDAKAAVSAK